MTTDKWELTPRYDSRQSFYGKALVIETVENGVTTYTLRSYSTDVARVKIYATSADVEVYGWYSQTTGRHIKDFLKQHGFRADNKAQILKDYYKEV